MQVRPMPSCGVCVSVCPCVCVTFVHSVKTNKDIFKDFSPSGSQACIIVLPYQTAQQYLTEASKAEITILSLYLALLRAVNAATGQVS